MCVCALQCVPSGRGGAAEAIVCVCVCVCESEMGKGLGVRARREYVMRCRQGKFTGKVTPDILNETSAVNLTRVCLTLQCVWSGIFWFWFLLFLYKRNVLFRSFTSSRLSVSFDILVTLEH